MLNNFFLIIGLCLTFFGLFLILSAVIGMFRFPDFYTKCHAAGVSDSCGLLIFLLGCALLQPSLILAVKTILLIVILFIIGPVATHSLVKAAWYNNLKPYKKHEAIRD